MELDDRITLVAPEGLELHVVLAGAASRFIAITIDMALQTILVGAAAILLLAVVGGGIGLALFAVATFAALYLYYIGFETLASGRTPGKRLTHLRVLRQDGAPVDLQASAVRNALRLIDLLPASYLVGLAAILLSRHNQRLGDIAAGTIVVREPSPAGAAPLTQSTERADERQSWDTSAVTAAEVAAARQFLLRRNALDSSARAQLAQRLADGLRGKIVGALDGEDAERFLELLVSEKN